MGSYELDIDIEFDIDIDSSFGLPMGNTQQAEESLLPQQGDRALSELTDFRKV